ncbi:uncharacterized protein LOC141632608 [Silene latifolia]|uniref:uncharacterized protein LOC141632608 n=1 Tax=Silene latifolia TaxID=37657 RepID=UPI003D77E3EC
MIKFEKFSGTDLPKMEKRFEEADLGEFEMTDDDVDVGSFDVVACDVDHVPVDEESEKRKVVKLMKEDDERKAKRWITRRHNPENRRVFMEELCKYWSEFEILLEFEVEESEREKRSGVGASSDGACVPDVACSSDVACVPDAACSSDLVSNSDDELDPVTIRRGPVITRWFLGELSKYWPGFGATEED